MNSVCAAAVPEPRYERCTMGLVRDVMRSINCTVSRHAGPWVISRQGKAAHTPCGAGQ